MTDDYQITITLSSADYEALEYIARTQYRTPDQQAAYFIMRLLAEMPGHESIEERKAAILARLREARTQEAPAP